MYYSVSSGIRYCVTGNAVVFLDMHSSRYFGLPVSFAEAFIRLTDRHGESVDGDDAKLAPLLKQGHLLPAKGPGGMCRRPVIEPPISDLARAGRAPIPLQLLVRAICSQLTMGARLKASSFAEVVDHLAMKALARHAPSNNDVGTSLQHIADAFERADNILGRADRCLVRSFALFSTCRSLGIPTTVVIGVRSDPFAAHCWLQKDDLVVNDAIESVAQFTPILVIE